MANQELNELQYAMGHYWRRFKWPLILLLLLLLGLWLVFDVFFQVGTDSRGVVLRLGKPLTPAEPGLHWKWPWPVDEVYVVPVEKVQSVEFGYRTVAAGRRTVYAPKTKNDESLTRMLTADLNLADVEWVVQYRIKDPNDYLFKVGGERRSTPEQNARDLISDVSEAVMRRIIGDVSVDTIITTGREDIGNQAKSEMQAMLDGFESGIAVVAVRLQSATPPEPVKDAFDAVNRAKQSKEKRVNDAKGEQNSKIPAAKGRKDRTIKEAEGYAARVKMEAEGEANAFLAKLKEYRVAPEVTRVRLYLEAMEEVFAQVRDKTIIDESVKGMLPLLHLDAAESGETTAEATRSNRARQARMGGVR